jgi:4-amino-4-deoxy-L-arabinose transferase-like glycosyltransferase
MRIDAVRNVVDTIDAGIEPRTGRFDRTLLAEVVPLLLLIPLIGYLSFVNLDRYPVTSGWDEGMYVEFASNVARYGEYATREGQEFNRLMPPGGTGPTLILPVAAGLSIGGYTLLSARLVMALFLLVTIAAVYVIARSVGGWLAGIVAIPIFLAAGMASYDTIWVGRQVLAEVPALTMVLLGLLAWFRSWNGSRTFLVLSSVTFGLAVITKNQLLWLAIPAFVLLGLADRFYYWKLRWWHTLAPIAGMLTGYLLWGGLQHLIVGSHDWPAYVHSQTALADAQFFHTGPHRWIENARFVRSSGMSLVLMIAVSLIVSVIQSRERSLNGLKRLTLPVFTSLAMMVFVLTSPTWARYLYLPLALAGIVIAPVLADAAVWLSRRMHQERAAALLIAVLLVSVISGRHIAGDLHRVRTVNDQSAHDFAAMIDQQIPASASIYSWEWEIDFYSDHEYTHPSYDLFSALFDQLYNGRYAPILDEQRIPDDVDYLVVGPFATPIGVFVSELEQRPHHLVLQVGDYSLYALR